jgi:hypothetical protein
MLEQAVNTEERKLSEQARALSRDMFSELIVAGRKDIEPVSYEQALVAIKYVRNEYVAAQAKEAEMFTLPKKFAEASEMKALFEGAFRIVSYEERHAKDESAFHRSCSAVYSRLRRIANDYDCGISEKIGAVDHLSARLHCDCASEGGFTGRIISKDDRFIR